MLSADDPRNNTPLDRERIARSAAGWQHLRRVEVLEACTSTNDVAARLADEGAPDGTVVVAEHQTAGRGRRGAPWFDLPRRNLLFSLLLRPTRLPARLAPVLGFHLGLALVEALDPPRERHPPAAGRPRLKWPNDVLLGGRKVGGLMAELSEDADGSLRVILGVGLNINLASSDIPPDLADVATSFGICGGIPLDRTNVLLDILLAIDTARPGWEAPAPADAWNRRAAWRNEEIVVRTGDDERRGVFVGLRADGALLLRPAAGAIEAILQADEVRPV